MPLEDGSGKYITYGASQHGKNVPYSLSGSGNNVGTSPKIQGDAMPKGGGAWAVRGHIWDAGRPVPQGPLLPLLYRGEEGC